MVVQTPEGILEVRNATIRANRLEADSFRFDSNLHLTSNLEIGTANLFVDTTTSNVGIGTNLPLAALDVRGYIKYDNPVFYAVRTVSGPSPNTYIIYDLARVNKGSHYNTSDGIFTCPVDGVYIFTFGGSGNLTNTVYRSHLRVNNTTPAGGGGTYQLRIDTVPSGNDYGWGEMTITADLLAGDTVRIFYTVDDNSTQHYGLSFSYFQGRLISSS